MLWTLEIIKTTKHEFFPLKMWMPLMMRLAYLCRKNWIERCIRIICKVIINIFHVHRNYVCIYDIIRKIKANQTKSHAKSDIFTRNLCKEQFQCYVSTLNNFRRGISFDRLHSCIYHFIATAFLVISGNSVLLYDINDSYTISDSVSSLLIITINMLYLQINNQI